MVVAGSVAFLMKKGKEKLRLELRVCARFDAKLFEWLDHVEKLSGRDDEESARRRSSTLHHDFTSCFHHSIPTWWQNRSTLHASR